MFPKRPFVFAVLTLVLCSVALAIGPPQGEQGSLTNPLREPIASITPGDTLPVTSADICVPGYSKKVRNVPLDVRRQAWAGYGLPMQKGRGWELDHLISLELGGSNSVKNLWPEPGSGDMNYHQKDALENRLHTDVCTNKMPLTDAQRMIAQDWEAAYRQYVEEQ